MFPFLTLLVLTIIAFAILHNAWSSSSARVGLPVVYSIVTWIIWLVYGFWWAIGFMLLAGMICLIISPEVQNAPSTEQAEQTEHQYQKSPLELENEKLKSKLADVQNQLNYYKQQASSYSQRVNSLEESLQQQKQSFRQKQREWQSKYDSAMSQVPGSQAFLNRQRQVITNQIDQGKNKY